MLSIVGLFAFVWSGHGRFLLLVLFASLVPYIFTWRVPNFGLVHHFRYTMHAYPIQLIAAMLVIVRSVEGARWLVRRGRVTWTWLERRLVLKGIATLGLMAAVWLGLSILPYLRMQEDLRAGRVAIVFAGEWDRLFFRSGWYPALTRGNVATRFSKGRKTSVWVPMRPGQDHRLTLRLDPFVFTGAPPQLLGVAVNGTRLGVLTLTWDRERVGEYTLEVPAEIVDAGLNRVDFEASYSTPVGSVATRRLGFGRVDG